MKVFTLIFLFYGSLLNKRIHTSLSNGSEYKVFQFTIWWKLKLIPGQIKNLINVFSKKVSHRRKHNMGL